MNQLNQVKNPMHEALKSLLLLKKFSILDKIYNR